MEHNVRMKQKPMLKTIQMNNKAQELQELQVKMKNKNPVH